MVEQSDTDARHVKRIGEPSSAEMQLYAGCAYAGTHNPRQFLVYFSIISFNKNLINEPIYISKIFFNKTRLLMLYRI